MPFQASLMPWEASAWLDKASSPEVNSATPTARWLLIMASPSVPTPQLPLEHQCYLCGHAMRIHILQELSRGQALPVGELARRCGCTSNAMSKQLALIWKTGVIVQTYGRLYALAPGFLPPAGATVLDLGQLVLKLPPPA